MRVAVALDRADHAGYERGRHGGVVFAIDVVQDDPYVIAGSQARIADHVPQRAPGDGSREGIVQVPEVLLHRVERPAVQSQLRVCEVAIVQQHKVGDTFAGQRIHLGRRAIDVELHRAAALEHPVSPIEQANPQPVRSQGGVKGRSGLVDHRAPDRFAVKLELRGHRVEPGSLEPDT